MTFIDRHVVVTGGTGALGIAVVGALIDAGASVTCRIAARTRRSASARGSKQVSLVALGDLADERR